MAIGDLLEHGHLIECFIGLPRLSESIVEEDTKIVCVEAQTKPGKRSKHLGRTGYVKSNG